MASNDRDLPRGDQPLDQHAEQSGNDNIIMNNTTGGGERQDDHLLSWLEATQQQHYQNHLQPPQPHAWPPLGDSPNVGPSQLSLTTEESQDPNVIPGGELPPPYTENDPAKDYPSTYEFELDENNKSNAKLYTPLFLRTWVLVAFAFMFALMLIAVEVMYQFSNRDHGLSTKDPKMHYLWTYGPTLFLTVVACFWGQVEYRVKQLMPWKTMTKGPVPAENALLMDYVSPWNVLALISGAKAKHIAVVLVICGSLLIKLAIIFATGLLSLDAHRVMEFGVLMQLKDTFTSAANSGNVSIVQPVITVIAASQYGLSFPPGTTSLYAAQSFEALRTIKDQSSILLADVDVFMADLQCDEASVQHISAAQCFSTSSAESCDTVSYNLTVGSSDCVTNSSQITVSIDNSTDQYYGSVSSSRCGGGGEDTGDRLTFISGHQYISYSDAGNATNTSAVICRPTYDICRLPVSSYLNGTIDQVTRSNASCSSISNISPWDISDSILSMVEYAASPSFMILPDSDPGYSGSYVNIDAFFKLMNATALPSNLTQFSNVTYLEDSVRNLYSMLAAQLAKSALMTPTEEQIQGGIEAYQQRLYVRRVSLRLLESIFSVLIAIAMVTLLLRPVCSTPSDVGKIAGMASVLARSPRTTVALQGLGSSGADALKQQLTGRVCHTAITNDATPTFSLTTSCAGEFADEPPTMETIKWWRPISMTIYARIGLAILPLALIAVLEAVYQHSAKCDGIVDVAESSKYHYVWTFIPALFMMLVQSGFQLVDFNTRIFQPFDTLRKAPATSERTMNVNYLSQTTPSAIWKAFSRRHYAVLMTGMTMFLAPLLTVVVSGLYFPARVEDYIPTSIAYNDTIENSVAWNNSDSSTSNLAETVSTLIAEANMSYVSWTYDGYVLPKLNTETFLDHEFGGNSTSNTTSVRVKMPAYSAVLNCTFTQPNVDIVLNQTGRSYMQLTVPVPAGCGDLANSSYFHLGDTTLVTGPSAYGVAYVPNDVSIPQDCPHVALVYGRGILYGDKNTADLRLSAATCSPSVYSVMVNTTVTMPDFIIQSVGADESTRQTVASGGPGIATLDLVNWFPSTSWEVDSFFGGLAPGRSGISWDDLLGEENFANFSAAVDDLYAIMYSQWLNIYGRTSPPDGAKPLDALVMDPTRMRLRQGAVSTRILEGLLAALAICVVAAYFFIDTAQVLPVNPCSIGAVTALLADSEIVKHIPEGAEWYKDKELREKRVFSDYLFSLDWFGGVGGTRRFGIDIGNGETGNHVVGDDVR